MGYEIIRTGVLANEYRPQKRTIRFFLEDHGTVRLGFEGDDDKVLDPVITYLAEQGMKRYSDLMI